jgi:DNA repair protein RadC
MRRLPPEPVYTPLDKTSRRYWRVAVTYTVARVPLSWPTLSSPEAAATFARELVAAHDDDRDHWEGDLPERAERQHRSSPRLDRSLSASIVHPRGVLGPALRDRAAHVIVTHCHPSGDPTTRQLVEGARLLGIRLHDLLGNGTGHWVSLAQRGLA